MYITGLISSTIQKTRIQRFNFWHSDVDIYILQIKMHLITNESYKKLPFETKKKQENRPKTRLLNIWNALKVNTVFSLI